MRSSRVRFRHTTTSDKELASRTFTNASGRNVEEARTWPRNTHVMLSSDPRLDVLA